MKRGLAVVVLALGLSVYGCGDDDTTTPDAGGAAGGAGGAKDGGTGGGMGGADAGGGGAGGAKDGGADMADAATPDASIDTAAEAGATEAGGAETGTVADICAAYVAGSGMLAGIAADKFCAKYETVCTFGGAMRYTDKADCMAKYMAAVAAGQTCRAGHLCNAAMAGGAATHCPHATGAAVCQ